ncbi:MAG TPA: hypothetical protein VGY76_02450 [Solirubrobacteraceae bacterium]|nr:hypothetical protein [Solirubrobacteraceae bacterium]
MSKALTSPDLERMRSRREAWARGATEAKLLDRERARAQTHEQRIAEGLELIRIAEKLQAGRRERPAQ